MVLVQGATRVAQLDVAKIFGLSILPGSERPGILVLRWRNYFGSRMLEQSYCRWKKLCGLGNEVSQPLGLESPVFLAKAFTVSIESEQKLPNEL